MIASSSPSTLTNSTSALLSYAVRTCNIDAFNEIFPYIEDPNLPDDSGQPPLLQAIDCIRQPQGDNIFDALLNHPNIDRQTSPPPLINLMADCHVSFVKEILKFDDTIVNFRDTLLTDYGNYLHDYLASCDAHDPPSKWNRKFRTIYRKEVFNENL